MSEDDQVMERLDALMVEIRRQGRAAIAAQATAEQCLERLDDRSGAAPDHRSDGEEAERWLRALLPVVDAVDRLKGSSAAMAAAPPRGLPWPFRRVEAKAEIGSLSEGIRVLQAQLLAALESLGVTAIEPAAGAPFDAELHRAVEVRSGRAGEVLEVIRPGYLCNGRVVREAEVVAGRQDR